MAVVGSRVTVGTSATSISAAVQGPIDQQLTVRLKNKTASAEVYLGGSAVLTTTGYEWVAADGTLEFTLDPDETLYGIVAATPQVVHILAVGR